MFQTPSRPRVDPDTGDTLLYRTIPRFYPERHQFTAAQSIDAQIALYRWVSGIDYVNNASIRSLNLFLAPRGEFSTKTQGATIHDAVLYSPTALKGVTKDNPKATAIYRFRNPLDLKYGLEWQICIWLSVVAKGSSMEDELEELAQCSEDDLKNLYLIPINEMKREGLLREPDWRVYFRDNPPKSDMDIINSLNLPKREGQTGIKTVTFRNG